MVLVDRLFLLAEDRRAFDEVPGWLEIGYHGQQRRLSAVTGSEGLVEWAWRNPDLKECPV